MNELARQALLRQLSDYAMAQQHAPTAAVIRSFVETEPYWWSRENPRGHITASAWVLSSDQTETLLVHHRKLNRWLQPGGHIEGDQTVFDAALREAREESGLTNLRSLSEAIFDVDIHPIPARPEFPAHQHLDIRYVFVADRTELLRCSPESHAVQWWPLSGLSRTVADVSIIRMAERTLAAGTRRLPPG